VTGCLIAWKNAPFPSEPVHAHFFLLLPGYLEDLIILATEVRSVTREEAKLRTFRSAGSCGLEQ